MKKVSITEADVAAVATRLKQLSPNIPGFGSVDPAWARPPAVLVIDCVLSLNRNYDTFLVPRLKTFMSNHPETQRLTDLAKLMASYPTPHAFMQQELDYNHESRARTLQTVLEFVCQIVKGIQTIEEEREILKQWAILAEPSDYQTLNIKGFGIAGFQYLRMLFGADTTKPDVHIMRFLSELLNRRISEVEALRLLEAASESVGLSVRDVDTYIWQIRARGEQNADETSTVKKTKLEYSEFWAPILSGEYGELFARESVSIRDDGSIRKKFRYVSLHLKLRQQRCYAQLFFLGVDKSEKSEHREMIMTLFPKSEYTYEYREASKAVSVVFPILDKGKKNRDTWDEIREKLVSKGTDIYNKIKESNL